MAARILPFVPRAPVPRVDVGTGDPIRAEDGWVLIPVPGGEPLRYTAEHAMAVAHAIETVAWTAMAQREDAERKGRR